MSSHLRRKIKNKITHPKFPTLTWKLRDRKREKETEIERAKEIEIWREGERERDIDREKLLQKTQ